MLIQCERCGRTFTSQDERLNHVQQAIACEIQAIQSRDLRDGITDAQRIQLKSRARLGNLTEAGRWKKIYRIVFELSEMTPTPSPCTSEPSVKQDTNTVIDFDENDNQIEPPLRPLLEDGFRDRLINYVQRPLGDLLQREIDALQNQISSNVERSQDRIRSQLRGILESAWGELFSSNRGLAQLPLEQAGPLAMETNLLPVNDNPPLDAPVDLGIPGPNVSGLDEEYVEVNSFSIDNEGHANFDGVNTDANPASNPSSDPLGFFPTSDNLVHRSEDDYLEILGGGHLQTAPNPEDHGSPSYANLDGVGALDFMPPALEETLEDMINRWLGN
jgi:hypothetical protein